MTSRLSRRSTRTTRPSLEAVERIAVILGAALGVAAFLWQVGAAMSSRRDDIQLIPTVSRASNYTVQLEVVNKGRRSIHIQEVRVGATEVPTYFTLGSDLTASGAYPIEPGSSKIFRSIEIDEELLLTSLLTDTLLFDVVTTRGDRRLRHPNGFVALVSLRCDDAQLQNLGVSTEKCLEFLGKQ